MIGAEIWVIGIGARKSPDGMPTAVGSDKLIGAILAAGAVHCDSFVPTVGIVGPLPPKLAGFTGSKFIAGITCELNDSRILQATLDEVGITIGCCNDGAENVSLTSSGETLGGTVVGETADRENMPNCSAHALDAAKETIAATRPQTDFIGHPSALARASPVGIRLVLV